jgi:hypothetical protein
MAQFDEEVVKRILVEELGLESIFLTVTIRGLSSLDDRLQPALDAWILDRTETDFTFQGISIKDIMRKHECQFISALPLMSALMHSPKLVKNYENLDFTPVDAGNPFEDMETE